MNQSTPATFDGSVIFGVVGFDRIQFVSDVLDAATLFESCQIGQITFEADGVRTIGQFTIRTAEEWQLQQIDRRLRNVGGLVQVIQRPVTVQGV